MNSQLTFGQMSPVEIKRLCEAGKRVYRLMSDGRWRTLREIADATQTSEAGASARLRDLRKAPFGSHTVNKRKRFENTYEYQLEPAPLHLQFRLGLV